MPPKLPIRVALIGCGAAFEFLYQRPLRRLQRRGYIRVVGFADAGNVRLELARSLFPGALVGTDVERLLKQSGPDLTLIVSPPPLHREHTECAMARGSDVLCEKPIADTVEAADTMARLAGEYRRTLAIGMTRRFYPCLGELRRLLAEKRIGKVVSYTYREGGVYTWNVASDAPFRRATSGGGVLLDKGTHVLDTLVWLFGAARVISHEDDAWVGGAEGCCLSRLDHGGIEGLVQLAWDHEPRSGFTIRGTEGSLYVPVGPLHDLFHRSPGTPWQRIPVTVNYPKEVDGDALGVPRVYYECFDFQLIQVLRALRRGERVPVGAAEAVGVLRLTQECYRASKPLAQTWLCAEERELAAANHWNAARSEAALSRVAGAGS